MGEKQNILPISLEVPQKNHMQIQKMQLSSPFHTKKPIGIDDERAVLVGSFDGSRDLLLTIPHDLDFDIHDLEWISMWSRDLLKNLGHADLVFIGTNYDETIDLGIEEISQRIESEIFHDEYELDIDNADDVEENEVDEDINKPRVLVCDICNKVLTNLCTKHVDIVSENDEDKNDENDDEDKIDENDDDEYKNDENDEIFNLFKRL